MKMTGRIAPRAYSLTLFAMIIFLAGFSVKGHSKDLVQADYSITLSGIPVAYASSSLVLTDGFYSAKLTAKTNALASIFVNSQTTMVSKGHYDNGNISPREYTLQSRSDEINLSVDMSLAGRALRSSVAKPGLRKYKDRIKVQQGHIQSIIDPLSSVLMTVRSTKAPVGRTACNRNLPIFDGWTRFDVALKFDKTQAHSVGDFTGDVAVCKARWKPVAGHRRGHKNVKSLAANKSMRVWLAEAGDSNLLIPVYISFATPAGTLVVRATTFTISKS